MDASARIRRHGYHLMSLASLGQFACFWLLLWNLSVRRWDPGLADGLAGTQWWVYVAFAVAVWLAQTWSLSRLRAIGKLLHAGGGVSHELSRAWMRLGHALAATGIIMVFPIRPQLGAPSGRLDVVLSLDAGGFYFFLIGYLCIFSVAHLVEQAATLRDENESIV